MNKIGIYNIAKRVTLLLLIFLRFATQNGSFYNHIKNTIELTHHLS